MQDKDPYDPSDEELEELNRTSARLSELRAASDARYAKRKVKHGPERARTGIWNDNPDGRSIWKASIAGIAVAYQEMCGGQGLGIDDIAQASGLSNNAEGISTGVRSENALGLADRKRAYSPGDTGKSVRRFISETLASEGPLVQAEYERAKDGDLLFESLESLEEFAGELRSGTRPEILIGIKSDRGISLHEALARARATGDKDDRKTACDKLLLAAEAYGRARYLFHGSRSS